MIVFDGFALIGLVIWIVIGIIYVLVHNIRKFLAWRKTGYCKHEYELYSTNSYGQYAWYKCDKCGDKKLK